MNVEQDGDMVNNQQGETNTQHEMVSDEDKLEPKLPEAVRDLPASADDAVGHKFVLLKWTKLLRLTQHAQQLSL